MLFFRGNHHAMDKYRHGENPFALVTGSSLGIGKAVAVELAALHFNVILHARTVEELEPVKEEIHKLYPGTRVVCLAQDAAVKVDWPHLLNQVKDLNITVLVNNVGTSSPFLPFDSLEKSEDDQIEAVIRVNTIFPTQITRNLLPTLMNNSPSLILNICSGSTYAPMAFLGIYCGSKASNLAWSQSLRNELRLLKRDVECKAVMTGNVATNGNSIPVDTFVPSAKVYAKSLLARADSSGPVYNGYWRHTPQLLICQFLGFFFPSVLDNICANVAKGLLVWRAQIGDKTALKVTDIPKYRHGERPFALVTGATAGIGKALAFELARLNFNVIIHGRTQEKLDPIRNELLEKHPDMSVVCLVQDASKTADWPALIKQLEGLRITVLINNVGASGPVPYNALECATDEQIETVIRVNTIFPTQLTRNLLPNLIENAPSLILNLTSGAALVFPPLLSVYSGTKSSNLAWSQALAHEFHYLKRDVTCKAVMTGSVQSAGHNRAISAFIPTSEVYAASLLARAGTSSLVYAGWWRHALQASVLLRTIVASSDQTLVCQRFFDELSACLRFELGSRRRHKGSVNMAAKYW
ncbi:hypothetical protein M408DRAFT_25533 [Serendipita vermifera MAFF 305830]|uniref:NAD(P)-binding protein n=1 Tax=Serendipita vermifera MAFF 305830 TaxID=933852 RepID=A0A0C2WIZ5_SERVB|nr:hypothetical protein M408DRAFT_25533 [Serendipita vermifera MAFF 305830]